MPPPMTRYVGEMGRLCPTCKRSARVLAAGRDDDLRFGEGEKSRWFLALAQTHLLGRAPGRGARLSRCLLATRLAPPAYSLGAQGRPMRPGAPRGAPEAPWAHW